MGADVRSAKEKKKKGRGGGKVMVFAAYYVLNKYKR